VLKRCGLKLCAIGSNKWQKNGIIENMILHVAGGGEVNTDMVSHSTAAEAMVRVNWQNETISATPRNKNDCKFHDL